MQDGAGEVYLRAVTKWKDRYYVAPGDGLVAAVTAEGNSWRKVLDDLKKKHGKVKVTDMAAMDASTFNEVEDEYIKPARKKGFKF